MIPSLLYTWRYLTFRSTSDTAPDSSSPPSSPLVSREFITTSLGRLELLHAIPEPSRARHGPAILFCHGGMGSAWVWEAWMSALAADHGIESYAVSLRGHGHSWKPGYLRMVFGFGKDDFVQDLAAAAKFVRNEQAKVHGGDAEIVLVGHSAGGGLSQYLLYKGLAEVKGLALLGAWPGYGGFRVYANWMSIDPWIGIRHALHLFHPNSPLSHPQLTRRAFFTPGSPESAVADVHAHLCPYESLRWPVGQMFPFVRRPELVVRRIGGWTKAPSDRMLVLYGAQDTLMNRPVNEKLARMYRDAAAKLNGAGPKENAVESSGVAEKTAKTTGKWTSEHGVRLASVEGAGHHLQNEPGKPMQDGLKQLVTWYEQL